MRKIYTIKELRILANDIRIDIIKMLAKAGSGHAGGSLSVTDILVALYFGGVLNYDSKRPNWKERDRFVLSNGHVCPALYAVLARAGYFSRAKLSTLRKINSDLQGHPDRTSLPGIETSAASLGQGIGVACGLAAAGKMDKANYKVICLTSDGEHQEGSTWEAVNFASHYKLDNLINIIDRNRCQISGCTEDVMHVDPLAKKYQDFGWKVFRPMAIILRRSLKVFSRQKRSRASLL